VNDNYGIGLFHVKQDKLESPGIFVGNCTLFELRSLQMYAIYYKINSVRINTGGLKSYAPNETAGRIHGVKSPGAPALEHRDLDRLSGAHALVSVRAYNPNAAGGNEFGVTSARHFRERAVRPTRTALYITPFDQHPGGRHRQTE
jgi:hypothetical protein